MMKPNWRRLVGGLLAVMLLFVLLILLDRKALVAGFFLNLAKEPYHFVAFNIVFLSAFALLGLLLARKKGRSPWRWLLACFVFHVYGLIYLWSLPDIVGHLEEVHPRRPPRYPSE